MERIFINLKLIAFCVLLFGILLCAGCTEELSKEEILSKLVEANSGLNSYSFDMKVISDTNGGNSYNYRYETSSMGDVDRANKKIFLKQNSNYVGGAQPPNGMPSEGTGTEEYFLNNYIYTKNKNPFGGGDAWMKMNLTEDAWVQKDQISQMLELIQSGTIERLGDEQVNGSPCYAIKINPDLNKMVQTNLKQEPLFGFFVFMTERAGQNISFADMLESYSSTVWVNKKTYVIEKSKTEMEIIMGGGMAAGSAEAQVDFTAEINISNINKEFNITLPEEAKDAYDLTQYDLTQRQDEISKTFEEAIKKEKE